MNSKKPVTKDMLILDVINEYPETFDIFIDHNIGCIGCRAAKFETLEEGMSMHGIDVDKFVDLLNEKIMSEKEQ
jgi:hybrid cluster-associated redox disulfide protein